MLNFQDFKHLTIDIFKIIIFVDEITLIWKTEIFQLTCVLPKMCAVSSTVEVGMGGSECGAFKRKTLSCFAYCIIRSSCILEWQSYQLYTNTYNYIPL